MWQPEREGSLGENGYITCMAESLHCSPETTTALFANQLYVLQYKIKSQKEKKHPVEDHFIRLLNLYTSERLNLCHHTLISALTDMEILVSKLLSFRTWGLYSIRLQVSTDADEKTAVSHGNSCSFVGNLLVFL